MTTKTIPEQDRQPILIRLWTALPVVVRAVVGGFLVFQFLQLGQFLLVLNFEFRPEIPWIAPFILLFLYVGWRYFSGWGPPTATVDARRRNMRIGARTKMSLLLGYATALVVLAHMVGLAVVTSSLIQFPEESFTAPEFVTQVPEMTAFAFILVYALVAGVSEEVGFRGYMQVPLEIRYGTVKAVILVAFLFWLAHFEHTSFVHRFPLLFGAGLFAGFLASYSRSLGPAIAVHFAADTIGFTAVSGLFGFPTLYSSDTIWQTGATQLFWQALALMTVAGALSIAMLMLMSKLKD